MSGAIGRLDAIVQDTAETRALLDAVAAADTGGDGTWTPPAFGHGDTWWLLAEQSDGYTVARHDGASWRTARAVARQVVAFTPDRLAELRVFRPGAEMLVHPDGRGGLRAVWRLHTDGDVAAPLRPRVGRAVQLAAPGGRSDVRDGFTVLHRPDGTGTVVPFAHERPALSVREHFDADPITGAVRVAVTCLDGYVPSAFAEEHHV
ncbi:hypothetical protein [Pseudonocardia alni]|uniref:hypothetical protein n=1 Tax=Pseudonocardia alni TaxID=33907 RepID=UPI00279BEEED|nr:hypothetical protein PaSha_12750 [Pseudonocardia alni]